MASLQARRKGDPRSAAVARAKPARSPGSMICASERGESAKPLSDQVRSASLASHVRLEAAAAPAIARLQTLTAHDAGRSAVAYAVPSRMAIQRLGTGKHRKPTETKPGQIIYPSCAPTTEAFTCPQRKMRVFANRATVARTPPEDCSADRVAIFGYGHKGQQPETGSNGWWGGGFIASHALNFTAVTANSANGCSRAGHKRAPRAFAAPVVTV